ncbi:peroxisomal membrane protein PMP34-like [Elysia marginata]|uniref:Peroxisomal membrane protein PMP34-like n=1 Tax=Elysia marginata TaxID=1093978 RepID=A0AAV4GQ19_9GAST|nr:peroxisomal membrane protein PMP34-like [Elysia marginata]
MDAAKTELAHGWSSLFTYSNLVHAVSGAAGSVVAISVFYPLDTVRTRLQVDDQRQSKSTLQELKTIIREEGVEGLYRGWFPVVTALCCSNFVYFYCFNGIKSVVVGNQKKARPLVDFCSLYRGCWSVNSTTLISSLVYFYTYACIQYFHHVHFGNPITSSTSPSLNHLKQGTLFMFLDLITAFVAGCVNVLLTTPLWVANTRLKLQGAKLHTEHYKKKTDDAPNSRRYSGILDCLLKIIQAEGVAKLWGGTVPSLLLATNPAIQFAVYEALKRYFRRILKVPELSGLLYFILGAVAKATATVITYPLQVVQSRLRAGYAKLESSQSLIQNIVHLVQTKGVGFLYKGMEAKLLQTVLTAALMFAIYEKIANFIFKTMGLR